MPALVFILFQLAVDGILALPTIVILFFGFAFNALAIFAIAPFISLILEMSVVLALNCALIFTHKSPPGGIVFLPIFTLLFGVFDSGKGGDTGNGVLANNSSLFSVNCGLIINRSSPSKL